MSDRRIVGCGIADYSYSYKCFVPSQPCNDIKQL